MSQLASERIGMTIPGCPAADSGQAGMMMLRDQLHGVPLPVRGSGEPDCGCQPYRQQPADLYPDGGNVPQPG